MVTLCGRQRLDVERLVAAAIEGPHYLPSVLLVGPPGTGKRTIARAAAESLGMDFNEVRLDGAARYVKEMLFGTAEQAERAEHDGVAPGEAGRNSLSLLYLSGLERTETSLLHVLHRLVVRRRYVDALGNEWSLSDDLWILGALAFPAHSQTLYPEHWLCTAFQHRLRLEPPDDAGDLLEICRSMVAQIGRDIDVSVGQIVTAVRDADDNLHALRRWIELTIPQVGRSGRLDEADFQRAMVEDIRWALSQMPYRGRVFTLDELDGWVKQFPSELYPLAVQLVKRIAEHYYIGQQRFHQAVDDLIRTSGIRTGSRVVFCRWQTLGESANRLAHIIKNQAGWRTDKEINLREPAANWPSLPPGEVQWFVLADDFVGSGGTLVSLFASPQRYLSRLLERYPRSEVRILIVAGFESGLRRALDAMASHRDRMRIVVSLLLRDEDRCFHPSSRVIRDAEQRCKLEAFCLEAGARHMPRLGPELRLGYEETGAIVVFYDSVPNNSLPILWYSHGSWKPLFPRSGLPGPADPETTAADPWTA